MPFCVARWLWSWECRVWWLFRGEEWLVGGDVECEGKESWKKVGRKVGSTCKWEVVVVVFVVVGVDLFVFLPLCSVVTALPAVGASLLQHARIA